jgi:hypothetical protein
MIKTVNITPALIRKLYKNPPIVNPTILARLPKLPATPCTAPKTISFDKNKIKFVPKNYTTYYN